MFRGLFRESTDSISSTETYESQLSDTLEVPTGSSFRGLQGEEAMEQIGESNNLTIPIQEPGGEPIKGSDKNEVPPELENLKVRRKYLRANLTKAITKFQLCIDNQEEYSAIFGAHSAVKLRFETLKEIESTIQRISPLDELEIEMQGFILYENNYTDTLQFLERLKHEDQNSTVNTSSTSANTSESKLKEVKIQSLTLPKFTGKENSSIDYFEFMDLFKTATEKYTDSSKAIILKNHVGFPASGSFGGILSTAENFPVMIERLNQKFGSPEVRLNKYVRKLLEYQPPKPLHGTELSARTMRSIADELAAIVRNLRLIDEESLTSENFMIALIQLKLPQKILIELNLGRDRSANLTLDGLFEAIENSVTSRELAELSEKRKLEGNLKTRRRDIM